MDGRNLGFLEIQISCCSSFCYFWLLRSVQKKTNRVQEDEKRWRNVGFLGMHVVDDIVRIQGHVDGFCLCPVIWFMRKPINVVLMLSPFNQKMRNYLITLRFLESAIICQTVKSIRSCDLSVVILWFQLFKCSVFISIWKPQFILKNNWLQIIVL